MVPGTRVLSESASLWVARSEGISGQAGEDGIWAGAVSGDQKAMHDTATRGHQRHRPG